MQRGARPAAAFRAIRRHPLRRTPVSAVPRAPALRHIRVAFIGARGVGGSYSGIESYYEEVGSRLAARGHEVTAYCRSHFTPKQRRYKGIHVRRLPCVRTKHLETLSHSTFATLDSLFRSYDIIQFHAIGSSPLALLPRLFGTPTVVSVRGLDWQRAKWGKAASAALRLGEWASARMPTATSVVSEELARHYRDTHRTEAICIPNAVSILESASPADLPALGLEPGNFLLFAGRISPEKGLDTLLEALPSNAVLAIAGGGSYTDSYVKQLRDAAGDRVVFLGNVPRDTLSELYRSCLAFVLPSHMEGLSVALLEALSHGACIVTTSIPANLEVVGDAALTFPVGDAPALRETLERLLDEPELAEAARGRARARAGGLPSWDEVALRTERFYLSLLSPDFPVSG